MATERTKPRWASLEQRFVPAHPPHAMRMVKLAEAHLTSGGEVDLRILIKLLFLIGDNRTVRQDRLQCSVELRHVGRL